MKIGITKLSTKDLGALAQRVIETTNESSITDAKNHLFLTKLKKSFEEYYATIGKLTFSGKGKSVAQADEERDKTFSNIKNYIESYAKIDTLPNHEDAVELSKIFKQFGIKMLKLNYAEETISMSKLVDQLSEKKNAERLRNINLEQSFNTLKDAHLNFKTLFDAQAQANSELRNIKPPTSARKDLEKDLKRFLDLVTLMHQTEQWTPLYLKLNEFVKATK